MEALAGRDRRSGKRRVVGNDEIAARLQGIEHCLVHLGAVDRHICRVVIPEEEGDEVEIGDVWRHRIVEFAPVVDHVLHRRALHARKERSNDAGHGVRRVLPIDGAAGCHGARHQFGAVAGIRRHIEILPARPHPGECEELRGLAPVVILPVGIGPIGCREQRSIVGRGRLRGARIQEDRNRECAKAGIGESSHSPSFLCDIPGMRTDSLERCGDFAEQLSRHFPEEKDDAWTIAVSQGSGKPDDRELTAAVE